MVIFEQKYKSAATSVNGKNHIPALARIWESFENPDGQVKILDYGCGKFDNTKEFFKDLGYGYYGYDPYNRDEKENEEAMANTDYDYAMLSNVLNVIAEKRVRLQVLYDIKCHLCQEGELYIKIYEGNGSGVMKVNERRNSCQLNLKTREYLPEVQAVFGVNQVEYGRIGKIYVIKAVRRD